jgi:hypothetical protein
MVLEICLLIASKDVHWHCHCQPISIHVVFIDVENMHEKLPNTITTTFSLILVQLKTKRYHIFTDSLSRVLLLPDEVGEGGVDPSICTDVC